MEFLDKIATHRAGYVEDGRAAQEQAALGSHSDQEDWSRYLSSLRSVVTGALQEQYNNAAHGSVSVADLANRLAFLDELSKEVVYIAIHPDNVVEGEYDSFCEKLAQTIGRRFFALFKQKSMGAILHKDDQVLTIPLDWELNALVRIIQYIFFEE